MKHSATLRAEPKKRRWEEFLVDQDNLSGTKFRLRKPVEHLVKAFKLFSVDSLASVFMGRDY